MNEYRMLDTWRKSQKKFFFKLMDAQECGNYRGIRLIARLMKAQNKIIEKRLRKFTSV